MNELNLQGLEVNDASAIDQVDIDNLLTGDGGSEEFNVADRELLHLIARDQQMAPLAETDPTGAPGYGNLQLGSNSSIDRLVSMPLGELNHSPGGFEPDPLMNSPVMNNHRNNNLSNLLAQQAQMGLEPNPMMSPQGMNQGMNHMIGQLGFQQQQQAPMQQNNDNTIQQLEQEKMKLLAKLNAINQQQDSMSVSNNSSMMGMQQQQQQQQPPQQPQGQMSQQQMLLMMQQQMNMQQQQQQQQQPKMNMQSNQMASLLQQQQNLTAAQRGAQRKPSLNTAVSGLTVKEPGESPLTSFLRAKGGGGAAGGAAASVSSLKTAGINGSSASVFSSSGATSVDPFNKGQGKLSGAMDRSIQTQSMIKQLAMSNTKGRASGRSGNAQWGSDGSKSQTYKYSGILPKHASDGHLLRNPNGPRQTGLYRQNSKGKVDLYGGLARSKGKLASRSKEQLNKLTKKSSSNKLSNTALNRLDGKDSSGALPVRASRTTGVSKYKFGVSGSMGNLGSLKNLGSLSNLEEFTNNFQHPNQQGGGGGGQYQGNAQW